MVNIFLISVMMSGTFTSVKLDLGVPSTFGAIELLSTHHHQLTYRSIIFERVMRENTGAE